MSTASLRSARGLVWGMLIGDVLHMGVFFSFGKNIVWDGGSVFGIGMAGALACARVAFLRAGEQAMQ